MDHGCSIKYGRWKIYKKGRQHMKKKKRHGLKYKLADGTTAKSVTTLIDSELGWNKRPLMNWTRRMALDGIDDEEEMREAQKIGTLTHLLIEANQKGVKDFDTGDFSRNQTEQAMIAFAGYRQWAEKTDFKPLKSEMMLVNEDWRVGGTIDCVGSIGDDLVLIDWKTAKYLYAEHKIQISAYIKMFEDSHVKARAETRIKKGLNPIYGMILRFEKQELKFHQHIVKRERVEAGIEAFDAIVKLSRLHKKV